MELKLAFHCVHKQVQRVFIKLNVATKKVNPVFQMQYSDINLNTYLNYLQKY